MPATIRLCCPLVLLLGLSSVAGADTQNQTASPSAGARLLAPVAPPKNPYGTLFLLPGQRSPRTAPRVIAPAGVWAATTPTAPTVVCGTLLVPIDPTIDSGIRRVPDASAPRPAIRAVEPTLCR